MSKFITQGVLNDVHFPYHDAATVNLAVHRFEEECVQEVHLLGDILDWSALSLKYAVPGKDPRAERAEADLGPTLEFLRRLRDLLPGATIYYHQGNHEDRLRRWLEGAGRPLLGLIEFEKLIRAKELRLKVSSYGTIVARGKLLFTHGNVIRKHSGYTARAMMEKYGTNVIFGHTHRGGVHYHTNLQGTCAAYENFCACRNDAPGAEAPVDWQQGFSLVHNDLARVFQVEQYPVIHGSYVSGGVLRGRVPNGICNGLEAK